MQSLTAEEKIAESLKKAEDTGQVISLLDEESTIGFDAAPMFTSKKRARFEVENHEVVVKTEKSAASETSASSAKVETVSAQPISKRVKLEATKTAR